MTFLTVVAHLYQDCAQSSIVVVWIGFWHSLPVRYLYMEMSNCL